MAIEKFVGTEKTLAPPGWKKPPHVIAAIKKRKSSRAFCPTGEGGGVDNSCGSGSGSGAGASSFSKWREKNSARLEQVRQSIEKQNSLAQGLLDDVSAKRAALYEKEDALREENNSIKAQLKDARPQLKKLLIDTATTEEEKKFWQDKDVSLIELSLEHEHLKGNKMRQIGVKHIGELKARRENVIAQLQKMADAQQEQADFANRIKRDAAKEAWAHVAAHAEEFATTVGDEGLSYSDEAYSEASGKFSTAVQGMAVYSANAMKDSAKADFQSNTKGPGDEFLSTVMSPVSPAASAIRRGAEVFLSDQTSRAYASGTEVHLSPAASASTYVHEMGHVMETDPSVREAAVAFRDARCNPSADRKMADVSPGSGYADSEVGNKDDFQKATKAVYGDSLLHDSEAYANYIGKAYKDSSGDVRATEVVSMGMQMMHDNPAAFAKADPEYFDFIVSIASGSHTRFKK